MLNYQITFPEIQALIRSGESAFDRSIADVAAALARSEINVLLLSGPSGSGKTTCAKLICNKLNALGRPASVLSLDDFFYDIKDRKEGIESLESEEHLDADMLYYCVHQLFSGEPTHVPSFDFANQRRVFAGKQKLLRENELLVIEGIHALTDKVTEVFSDIPYCTAFVYLDGEYLFPDLTLSSNRARLLRRISRDAISRGASPEYTLEIWDDVTEYENARILPEGEKADFKISTHLEHEPYILRKPLLKALELIDESGKYADFKSEFTEFAKKLTAVSPSVIPESSVLHEFIG